MIPSVSTIHAAFMLAESFDSGFHQMDCYSLAAIWKFFSVHELLPLRTVCGHWADSTALPLKRYTQQQHCDYTLSPKIRGALTNRSAVAVAEKIMQIYRQVFADELQRKAAFKALLHKKVAGQPLPPLFANNFTGLEWHRLFCAASLYSIRFWGLRGRLFVL